MTTTGDIMEGLERAVIEYEEKRQLVYTLNKKRSDLLSSCTKYGQESDICLVEAYRENEKLCRESGELYSFEGTLEEGNAGGVYCDNCFESYNIKKGPLKEARIAFGMAKRKMSYLGKRLIKESSQVT